MAADDNSDKLERKKKNISRLSFVFDNSCLNNNKNEALRQLWARESVHMLTGMVMVIARLVIMAKMIIALEKKGKEYKTSLLSC